MARPMARPRRAAISAGLAAASWQKELQRTAAIAALETVNTGNTTTLAAVWAKMAVLYHGNPQVDDSIGYADHLLVGRGSYERLWVKEDLVVNASGNDARGTDAFDLVLDRGVISEH